MVRKLSASDARELRRLCRALYGHAGGIDPWDEQVFVFDKGEGRLGGFISVSRRMCGEGAVKVPVAHVGSWFVDRRFRRQGIGTTLMRAAEHWARLNGFPEICSDSRSGNRLGRAAHQGLGFEPTFAVQYFRKALG